MIRTALLLSAVSGSAIGAVGFSNPLTLAASQRPSGVTIADFNGDGLADLAVTVDTVDRVLLFRNTGTTLVQQATIVTGANSGPDQLVATDLDADGDLDLVVVLKNQDSVRAYINGGAFAFTAGALGTTGSEPISIAMGDAIGDGAPEFATANRSDNTVSVLRYQTGAFTTTTIPVGNDPRWAAFADITGDGRADLAVSNHDDRTVSIFKNTNGAFAASSTLVIPSPYRPDGLALGDVDGDGDRDLIVAKSDDAAANQIARFLNDGTGAFGAATNFVTGGINTSHVAVADLDADGDIDVVTSNQDSNNVSVLENNGLGAFGAPTLLAAGTRPGTVALGNVFGRVTPEIAVANRDSNTVVIWENLAGPLCAADYNGDGFVTGDDFDAYVADFVEGAPASDFNGDGFVTGDDFDAFTLEFEAGC